MSTRIEEKLENASFVGADVSRCFRLVNSCSDGELRDFINQLSTDELRMVLNAHFIKTNQTIDREKKLSLEFDRMKSSMGDKKMSKAKQKKLSSVEQDLAIVRSVLRPKHRLVRSFLSRFRSVQVGGTSASKYLNKYGGKFIWVTVFSFLPSPNRTRAASVCQLFADWASQISAISHVVVNSRFLEWIMAGKLNPKKFHKVESMEIDSFSSQTIRQRHHPTLCKLWSSFSNLKHLKLAAGDLDERGGIKIGCDWQVEIVLPPLTDIQCSRLQSLCIMASGSRWFHIMSQSGVPVVARFREFFKKISGVRNLKIYNTIGARNIHDNIDVFENLRRLEISRLERFDGDDMKEFALHVEQMSTKSVLCVEDLVVLPQYLCLFERFENIKTLCLDQANSYRHCFGFSPPLEDIDLSLLSKFSCLQKVEIGYQCSTSQLSQILNHPALVDLAASIRLSNPDEELEKSYDCSRLKALSLIFKKEAGIGFFLKTMASSVLSGGCLRHLQLKGCRTVSDKDEVVEMLQVLTRLALKTDKLKEVRSVDEALQVRHALQSFDIGKCFRLADEERLFLDVWFPGVDTSTGISWEHDPCL